MLRRGPPASCVASALVHLDAIADLLLTVVNPWRSQAAARARQMGPGRHEADPAAARAMLGGRGGTLFITGDVVEHRTPAARARLVDCRDAQRHEQEERDASKVGPRPVEALMRMGHVLMRQLERDPTQPPPWEQPAYLHLSRRPLLVLPSSLPGDDSDDDSISAPFPSPIVSDAGSVESCGSPL